MNIETVDDVVNHIADLIGCYGACKAKSTESGCDLCPETKIDCCRVGFTMEMADRIRDAVHNEDKLNSIGL